MGQQLLIDLRLEVQHGGVQQRLQGAGADGSVGGVSERLLIHLKTANVVDRMWCSSCSSSRAARRTTMEAFNKT